MVARLCHLMSTKKEILFFLFKKFILISDMNSNPSGAQVVQEQNSHHPPEVQFPAVLLDL